MNNILQNNEWHFISYNEVLESLNTSSEDLNEAETEK